MGAKDTELVELEECGSIGDGEGDAEAEESSSKTPSEVVRAMAAALLFGLPLATLAFVPDTFRERWPLMYDTSRKREEPKRLLLNLREEEDVEEWDD